MARLATASLFQHRPEMGVPVRISVGRPRNIQTPMEHIGLLAPYGLLDRKLDRPTFTRLYIQRRLERAGIELIDKEFRALHAAYPGLTLVLLCFENLTDPGAWCHRRIFAEWWEQQTGEVVPEIGGTR